MRGIKATNLVNKEVSVQTKLKMDLSKLRHWFFPEKAESPQYFTNLEKGGQKGGQGRANFSLKFQLKFDFFSFLQSPIYPTPMGVLLQYATRHNDTRFDSRKEMRITS